MDYLKPSFFIIGERKCGTSSFYRYLVAHPNVLPCALKEPNFFGNGAAYVRRNTREYWALFPKRQNSENIKFSWPELNEQGVLYHEPIEVEREVHNNYITGEASANTFYEVDPQLVKSLLPDIKLILLFRNPVDRAFSHHRMYQRFQEEGRDLGFKVNGFETDFLKESALIKNGIKGEYLSPGIYLNQLQPWMGIFGKEQIRVYFLEDLQDLKKGQQIMQDIQKYLELPSIDYSAILQNRYNVAPVLELSENFREKITSFYKPYNEKLAEYLQLDLPW